MNWAEALAEVLAKACGGAIACGSGAEVGAITVEIRDNDPEITGWMK